MVEIEWIKCPICGNKTRNQIWADTVLESLPLFCPKCKQERLLYKGRGQTNAPTTISANGLFATV